MTGGDSQTESFTLIVPAEASGERLDRFLGNTSAIPLSRNRIQQLIKAGLVLVDGSPAIAKLTLKGGEKISLDVPPAPEHQLEPEEIDIPIVFCDDHIVVVNKPAGLVTHPAAGNHTGTLVHALLYHVGQLSSLGGATRPGIVHRLDKNTSGLLVAALTDQAYLSLQSQIKDHKVSREYVALIWGHMKVEQGTIDLPLARSTRDRKKMAVRTGSGKQAVTHYKVSRRFRSYDLLDISLQTGRTHQIRVHLSHLGHPVFGDPDYGGRTKSINGLFGPERPLATELLSKISRQALHARRLEFSHPVSGELLEFVSDLPEDMAGVLDQLNEPG